MKDIFKLLDEVTVDSPRERETTIASDSNHGWPPGFWAVSDENGGYIAYFAHESDAWGFRLYLINLRMNGGRTAERYDDDDEVPTVCETHIHFFEPGCEDCEEEYQSNSKTGKARRRK